MKIPEHLQRFDWYEPHQEYIARGCMGANRADLMYADLRYANLRYADLRDANLRYANLRYADLRDANLRDADLRDADLRDANLRDANLSGADLRDAEGVHLLTQTDHGYLVHATWRDGWRVVAGCRDFSMAEAREHWGAADYPIPSSGSRIVALLDWLEKQPVPEDDAARKPE